jgi:hypothetical protein
VAAQCHLVYAVTAVALVVIAPLAAWAYGVRPSRWRWCAVGLFVGAACWVLPLFQEITGHPGNMSLIVDSGGTQARVGLGFGLHVLSTAAAPHPIWLTQFPIVDAFVPNGISHYVDGHSEVWAVLVLALVLGVPLVARRTRRELSALAVIALLVAGGTVVSFAAFPRNQLDLVAYLVNVFWAVGMILWIVVVWAAGSLAAAGFRRWRGGPDHLQSRAPIARGLEVAALLLLAVAGVAGVRALVPAAHAQAAEARADAPLDRAIARSIERSVPPGPVIVTVRPSSFGPRYGNYSIDDWGVALVLLEDGWRPGLRDSFFGVATHLSVPPGAHWPEVIVRVNPATKAVIGAQRVDPARPRG